MPINQFAKISPFVNNNGILCKVDSNNFVLTDSEGNPKLSDTRLKNGEIGILYNTGDLITCKRVSDPVSGEDIDVIMYLNSNVDICELDLYNNIDTYIQEDSILQNVRSDLIYDNYIESITYSSNGNFYNNRSLIEYIVRISIYGYDDKLITSLDINNEDLLKYGEKDMFKEYIIDQDKVSYYRILILKPDGSLFDKDEFKTFNIIKGENVNEDFYMNLKVTYKPNRLKNVKIMNNKILYDFNNLTINGNPITDTIELIKNGNEINKIDNFVYTKDYQIGGNNEYDMSIVSSHSYEGTHSFKIDKTNNQLATRLKLKCLSDDQLNMNCKLTFYVMTNKDATIIINNLGSIGGNYSIPNNSFDSHSYAIDIQANKWTKVTYRLKHLISDLQYISFEVSKWDCILYLDNIILTSYED